MNQFAFNSTRFVMPRMPVMARLLLALTLVLVAALFRSFQPALTAANQVVDAHYSICVRPGGTSLNWSYGQDFVPEQPGLWTITQMQYNNLPVFGWNVTRGYFQYSTDGGGNWNNYTLGTYQNTAGKLWHFVDTAPGDTTTMNTAAIYYWVSGWGSSIGSSANIIPDNPPTDITPTYTNVIMSSMATGGAVASLSAVDTGCGNNGYWEIDSQSVPDLFTISFNPASSTIATLKMGTGTKPAEGETATVTVRYYDLYQTDSSGVPIPGEGVTKQLSYTFRSDTSKDLNFSSDASASTVPPVYSNFAAPQMATLSNGNFVVVWTEFGHGNDAKAINGTNNDFGGVYARLYNRTNSPLGPAFAITPVGDGVDTYDADVAALSGGKFVVTYQKNLGTPTATNYDVAYRIVDANGTVGGELIAHAADATDQSSASVATLTDGSFVIAWSSGVFLTSGKIMGQQFAALDGSKVGGVITIHNGSADIFPDVAALSDGSYAVAWGDVSTYNVVAVVSSALGSVIDITTDGSVYSTPYYMPAPVATGLAGGGFVVAFESYANNLVDYDRIDVFFQRLSNAGALQGSLSQANATGGSGLSMVSPGIAQLSEGGFVLAWQYYLGDYDLSGIFGRRFSSLGVAVDANDFEINQYRPGDQVMPSLTPIGTNLFAAAWESDLSSSQYTVKQGVITRVLLPETCIGIGSGTVPWSVAFAACPHGAKLVIPAGLDVYLDTNVNLEGDLEVLGSLDATSQAKTFTLTGSGDQSLIGNPLIFYNLTLDKANKTDVVTITGKLKVTKKLTVTRGKLKSASDYGDVEIAVDGTLELTSDITVGGYWTNDGDFISGGYNVTFDGVTPQVINGAATTGFGTLTVASGSVVGLVSKPTAAAVVNNGVLSETLSVGASSTVNFLTISTDKYQGATLTTDADNNPGLVMVSIQGNNPACTAEAIPPSGNYRDRCFKISAANEAVVALDLYSTAAEDDVTSDVIYQWNTLASAWADVTSPLTCSGTDGAPCSAADVTLTAGQNYFLIGDYNDSPTDLRLVDLSATLRRGWQAWLQALLNLFGFGRR